MPEDRKGSLAFHLYDLALGEEDARLCRDIPESQCREQPASFLYQVLAQAFSKIGDGLADTKVVLPWLLGAVGAPLFLVGFLVPIRESLALLPQVLIGGVIRRFPIRKNFWVASSLVEGLCVVSMACVAIFGLRGAAAGWAIIGLLVVFSLARGVASIAAKDTLGKTVSKGRRGRVSGFAATASGVVISIVGLYLALSPASGRPEWLLFAIVLSGGLCWFVSAAAFYMIIEFPGATEGSRSIRDLVHDQIVLLLKDLELQKFLTARVLMTSTALVGPVYVTLAQRKTGAELDSLGWLVIASGAAGALSSIFWGIRSDNSSRMTMAYAAALAGALGIIVLAAISWFPDMTKSTAFYAIVVFITGIAHAGVRIGRKTHIVDLAGGDRKAEYVALSNTIIGLLLLIIGALIGILLEVGIAIGVGVLSAMSLTGAVMALKMKHAQN